MNLYEYEGKRMFRKYGIPTPKGSVVAHASDKHPASFPLAVKAQVRSGDRLRAGGVLFPESGSKLKNAVRTLLGKKIGNEFVEKILIEERVTGTREYYISISYDTFTRTPVLALSRKGGSGADSARLFPIDILHGIREFDARTALAETGFPSDEITALSRITANLWRLFYREYALLAEINPLTKDTNGNFVALDAKVVIDDEHLVPARRPFLTLGGDIAVLASGGGASLINIDALMRCGGRPANYTEYSGNPSAESVKRITRKVLNQKGLRGCWVIGGTANFTDIYETMRGFLEGVRSISPKPRYPFIIRRDGPRQKEAMAMLREAAERWGYDFNLYDSATSMAETARILVRRAYTH